MYYFKNNLVHLKYGLDLQRYQIDIKKLQNPINLKPVLNTDFKLSDIQNQIIIKFVW